jgi:hypothetical protein
MFETKRQRLSEAQQPLKLKTEGEGGLSAIISPGISYQGSS